MDGWQQQREKMMEESRIKLTFNGDTHRSSSFEDRYSIKDDSYESPKDFVKNEERLRLSMNSDSSFNFKNN
jgi:hypothetical protein